MVILDHFLAQSLLKPRLSDSNKSSHGHAFLIAGNSKKMGAAVIATKACLRAGAGLAADLALENQSIESLLISNVIDYLGKAFEKIRS